LVALRVPAAATGFKSDATVQYDDLKNEWRLEVESDLLRGESSLRFSILTASVVGTLHDNETTWKWQIQFLCARNTPRIKEVIIKNHSEEKPEVANVRDWMIDGVDYSVRAIPIAGKVLTDAFLRGFEARIYDAGGYKDVSVSKEQLNAAAKLARNISAGRVKKERKQTVTLAR